MKKYIGLFLILYILFQFNNLSYSQDDRWVYITESDRTSFYVDERSVKCDEYGNIEVWQKEYCLSDCREKIVKENKHKIIEYTICKCKYYLDMKRKKTLYIVDYYTDNSTFSYDCSESDSESEIVPESIGETIYNYILKNYPCK